MVRLLPASRPRLPLRPLRAAGPLATAWGLRVAATLAIVSNVELGDAPKPLASTSSRPPSRISGREQGTRRLQTGLLRRCG